MPPTTDEAFAIPDLSVLIGPSAENGCSKPCCTVAHLVTATAMSRVRPPTSRITPAQLALIRQDIALAISRAR
ncbi:hypothetical protein [Rhodopila sp.]|uniref:hypothetical protein n=1 Tax=Rhodopila sp. TaxID=2480087 RepID=UPI002CD1CBE7|nr:hypothetical protein [Rhodopila sp.]HVZ08216.1 hypothetical protein [Rhodopila sp.]